MIKNAISTDGTPVKVNPYSMEMLDSVASEHMFQDIILQRINVYYQSYDYVKKHEEFDSFIKEIESKPELKKIACKIDDIVSFKETECFDAGYKTGMADLMMALTLNSLQVINTQVVDFEAIGERREASKND